MIPIRVYLPFERPVRPSPLCSGRRLMCGNWKRLLPERHSRADVEHVQAATGAEGCEPAAIGAQGKLNDPAAATADRAQCLAGLEINLQSFPFTICDYRGLRVGRQDEAEGSNIGAPPAFGIY